MIYEFKVTDNLVIPIEIVKGYKYKRISLKKNKGHGFTLTSPLIVKESSLFNFINMNHSWLLRHHKITSKQQQYFNGDKISVFGKFYTIKHSESLRGMTKIDEKQIEVHGIKENIKTKIHIFLKKLLLENIREIINYHCSELGVKYSNISIRNTNSRWGSCNSDKRIMFSLKLVQCPFDVVEYVVVHELCHILEMNHSRRFWDLVQKQLPEFKDAVKWLKTEGRKVAIL